MRVRKLENFGLEIQVGCETEIRSLDRGQILKNLWEHKLVLVRGLKGCERDEFLNFVSKRPEEECVSWSFGPVMELKQDPLTSNYLFSSEVVPYHWDGAFHIEPRVLVFNCVKAPDKNSGGQTFFCNTEIVWKKASADSRNLWREIFLSYETEKLAHYGGKITVPMVQKHPVTGRTILRYAEAVESALNPVQLKIESRFPLDQNAIEKQMKEVLYSEDNIYEHQWEDNDLLLADNFALVHGRRAFTSMSPRHLRRIQLR